MICDACKSQHAPHRKAPHGPPDLDTKPPKYFGDQATMDHIIYSQGDQSVKKDRVALVLYDRATHWLDSIPSVANDTIFTKQCLIEFYVGDSKPKKIYSDNAPELVKACTELEYPHDTNTPHRPQSNGVCERCVRKVKEGTKCVLLQSGLHPLWWCWAMRCSCFLYNIVEKCFPQVSGPRLTPYQARFQSEFSGPIFPFGCSVEYQPSNPDYKDAGHAMGPKTRRGLFSATI